MQTSRSMLYEVAFWRDERIRWRQLKTQLDKFVFVQRVLRPHDIRIQLEKVCVVKLYIVLVVWLDQTLSFAEHALHSDRRCHLVSKAIYLEQWLKSFGDELLSSANGEAFS